VDREGRSLDGRGRPIDVSRYLLDEAGRIVDDDARDHEYTRELGEQLSAAFLRGNTVMVTHLVAFAAFAELRRMNPGLDLYRFLRTGGDAATLPLARLVQAVERLRARLADLAGRGRLRLSERVRAAQPDEQVLQALRAFGTYHTRPALERVGDRVHARDRALLLYYRNRLTGYGLEEEPA
jgi:glycerol-3-phosphate O-acyltransferase